jgi:hypothetical protein
VTRGPCINGASANASEVLRNMRRHIDLAAGLHESSGVVSLVRPNGYVLLAEAISSSISAAAPRSAVPAALVACTLTTSPWRLSVTTWPRKLGSAGAALLLR